MGDFYGKLVGKYIPVPWMLWNIFVTYMNQTHKNNPTIPIESRTYMNLIYDSLVKIAMSDVFLQ